MIDNINKHTGRRPESEEEMNRSKLYDGLSEIERDQVSKELTKITRNVSDYSLDFYKAYMIGVENEKLRQKAENDLIKWTVYQRICVFLIDWVDNFARKNLGLD